MAKPMVENLEVAMKSMQDRDSDVGEMRPYTSIAKLHHLGWTVSRLRALRRKSWKLGSKLEAERAPWRRSLGKVLQSSVAHSILVTLLAIDLLITAIAILETIVSKTRDLKASIALLESCQCTTHFEKTKQWTFLEPMSMSILCVLLLNVLGMLAAFGRSFFTHPGYILDLVILPVAMFLEIFEESGMGGLLLILNLWRIVMVAHSILEVAEKATKKHLRDAEKQTSELVKTMAEDQDQMQTRIQELEKALQEAKRERL